MHAADLWRHPVWHYHSDTIFLLKTGMILNISFFFLYSNVLKKNLSFILLRLMAGCMFVHVTQCFYGFEEFHSQSILFNSFKETSISPSILPSTLCRDTEGCSICQHTVFPAYIYYELGQVSTLTGRPYISRPNHTWSPFMALFPSYRTFTPCVPVMLDIKIYL